MNPTPFDTLRLTQFSHGAGCGCKLSPQVLGDILATASPVAPPKELLVGNDTRDDAAVYDLGDGRGMVSTTDFFMPIVDDPFEFGQIAATNAISDIYAMGGTPTMALAVLGWPIDKIPADVARRVVDGGREACRLAGIPLAGGHSIDNPEPLFGLAVSGLVDLNNLKRNDQARAGCILFLTKPLGIGILTTAGKNGVLKPEHKRIAPDTMLVLNKVGAELGPLVGVSAMTDVTGFGLLGHLLELCEGSGVDAVLEYSQIPVLPGVQEYIDMKQIPGGTKRNWNSYGSKVALDSSDPRRHILTDAQTSGGLLVAVDEDAAAQVQDLLSKAGLHSLPIGRLVPRDGGSDRNPARIRIV